MEQWQGTYRVGNDQDETTRSVVVTMWAEDDMPVAEIDDELRDRVALAENEDIIDGDVEEI